MPLKRSGFKKKTYEELKAACYPLTPTRRRLKQAAHRLARAPREEDQAWARAVKERDGYKCQWPTGPHQGIITAHHINERSQRPDLIHDVDNGAAICASHHDYLHHTVAGRREAKEYGLLGGETYEKAMKAGRTFSD